jgi:hypothetical protein
MGKEKSQSLVAADAPVKRWNAYTCPDCRGIFRAPRDYEGHGVICPMCDRMLRMPRKGEEPTAQQQPPAVPTGGVKSSAVARAVGLPKSSGVMRSVGAPKSVSPPQRPLMPALIATPVDESATSDGSQPRVSRIQNKQIESDEEWGGAKQKRVTPTKKHGSAYEKNRFFLISFGVLGAIFLIAVLMKSLQPEVKKGAAKNLPDIVEIMPEAAPIKKEAAQGINSLKIESVVKNFMTAETLDEMKQFVFLNDALDKKIDAYYKDHPWKKPGFFSLFEDQLQVTPDGLVCQAKASDANFNERDIFLRTKGNSYQVDWESWVGWSEMGYEELRKSKPKQAVEVRVIVSAETYFNFDFPKEHENRWQSYKLSFPLQESALHGYVARAGKLDDELRMNVDEKERYMILRVRYPEKSTRDDQILVDSVVQVGWVK